MGICKRYISREDAALSLPGIQAEASFLSLKKTETRSTLCHKDNRNLASNLFTRKPLICLALHVLFLNDLLPKYSWISHIVNLMFLVTKTNHGIDITENCSHLRAEIIILIYPWKETFFFRWLRSLKMRWSVPTTRCRQDRESQAGCSRKLNTSSFFILLSSCLVLLKINFDGELWQMFVFH